MSIDFIKSSKGKDVLRLDGNEFYKKFTRSNNVYWDCKFRRLKGCPSYAVTNGRELMQSTSHNHSYSSNTLQNPEETTFKVDEYGDQTEKESYIVDQDNSIDNQSDFEVLRKNAVAQKSLENYDVGNGKSKPCHRNGNIISHDQVLEPPFTSLPKSKSPSSASESESELSSTESENENRNNSEDFDIANWSDPNLLVERIRFLMSTPLYILGIHNAEIHNIIEELKKAGYIY